MEGKRSNSDSGWRAASQLLILEEQTMPSVGGIWAELVPTPCLPSLPSKAEQSI